MTKPRTRAFAGTDLDMTLGAKEIDTLMLFGIATSGVVLSTLLHAADADYRFVVLKDSCADLDRDVHAGLVNKVFTRQVAVISASEFLKDCDSVQPSPNPEASPRSASTDPPTSKSHINNHYNILPIC